MATPSSPESMPALDLTALRSRWAERRAAVEAAQARVVPTGLRRPARDPDERSWLEARGDAPFIEDEAAAEAARQYYARKYSRPMD
jgi:hypothetical protein